MEDDDQLEWIPLKEAASRTRYTTEAMRKWAASGRVRSRRVSRGKRQIILVAATDVRREVGQPERTPSESAGVQSHDEITYLRDRVATLEEVARRYRHIEALRDEVVERQVEIARQHREIEMILQGPSVIPEGRG